MTFSDPKEIQKQIDSEVVEMFCRHNWVGWNKSDIPGTRVGFTSLGLALSTEAGRKQADLEKHNTLTGKQSHLRDKRVDTYDLIEWPKGANPPRPLTDEEIKIYKIYMEKRYE